MFVLKSQQNSLTGCPELNLKLGFLFFNGTSQVLTRNVVDLFKIIEGIHNHWRFFYYIIDKRNSNGTNILGIVHFLGGRGIL